jgi:hypothetical protein
MQVKPAKLEAGRDYIDGLEESQLRWLHDALGFARVPLRAILSGLA